MSTNLQPVLVDGAWRQSQVPLAQGDAEVVVEIDVSTRSDRPAARRSPNRNFRCPMATGLYVISDFLKYACARGREQGGTGRGGYGARV